jgi:ABC-2 type transport system permease protein
VTGFGTLVRKELLEQWRTRRLIIVGIVFLLFGIGSPLVAKFTPEMIKAIGEGMPGATIEFPPPTTADAVAQLAKNVGQLGVVVAILLSMGAVAAEKERGTAAFILTLPAGRAAFLGAKLVAIGFTLLVAVALAAAGDWLYTTILFEPLPIPGFVALALLLWLQMLAFAAITFLASTVTGSQLVAGGVGFVVFVVVSVVAALPVIGDWTPLALSSAAIDIAMGEPSDVLVQSVVASVAIVGVCAVASWASFRRQEL